MRKAVPGYDDYCVEVNDEEVLLLNSRGKRMKNNIHRGKVKWQLVKDGVQRGYYAEDIIAAMFPEIPRREWIFKLYRGVVDEKRERTYTVEVIPGVKLTNTWIPGSYYLETPLEMDFEKDIKKMFPGFVINIEEGNNLRTWREIYFHADECFLLVLERMKIFFGIP